MPLVHFDRQVVLDFFGIPIEELEETLKHIEYKDPIDVHDEFSGDDIKAIAMTYAHRKYPAAIDKDKVSFGSQVSYCVCGMYTGVAHYYKEQKAERVFEEFKKAFGVEPGDEGPEIRGDITAADFTRASILILEGMILFPDSGESINVNGSMQLLQENASIFDPARLATILKTLSGFGNLNL
jgi:hypothetical protein